MRDVVICKRAEARLSSPAVMGTLRRWLASPLPLLVLAIAVAGLLLSTASLPHTHAVDRPGLYNQEHDLGYLATFGGVGPVPDAPAAMPLIVLVALVVAAATGPAPDVGRRHADFRAPPLR